MRARIESVLAVLFALAAVATAIWPRWIEDLTRLEPDGGSGESEWWLVLLLGAAALVAGVLALRDRRRLSSASGDA